MRITNHFHISDCDLSLASKQTLQVTLKWPILQMQLWEKMRVLGWIMCSIGPTGLNLFIEK